MKTVVGSDYRMFSTGNRNKTFIEMLLVLSALLVLAYIIVKGIYYVEASLESLWDNLEALLTY